MIILHYGQGNFGRCLPSDASTGPKQFNMTYVSALSGMIKSIVSEYQSVRPTVVDICRQEFDSDTTRCHLDFICALEEPEREYTISHSGLYVHAIIPYQPSIEQPLRTEIHSQPKCVLAIGGARGIAVSALERIGTKHISLVLTGRSDLTLPSWIRPDSTTAQVRSHLIELHQEAGDQFTPASIERELRTISSSREAISTIERLSSLYASVAYIKVDFLDRSCDSIVLDFLKQNELRVDTVVNVAGIIEDSLVHKKAKDSFERVLLTKLNALKLTFRLVETHPVTRVLNYASVAGKVGNLGQSDYSAANELINAGSWLSASLYPSIKINSVNWGPWASAGMATKEVNDAFAHKGIIPIPLDLGAQCIAELLTTDYTLPLEITTGVYDVSKFSQSEVDIDSISESYPYLGAHSLSSSMLTIEGKLSKTYRFLLDPNYLPYLRSHQKFGRPVMPAALSCVFAVEAYQRENATTSLPPPDSVLRITTEVLSGIVFDNSEPQEFLYEVSSPSNRAVICTLRNSHSSRCSYRTHVQEIPRPVISSDLLSALSTEKLDVDNIITIGQSECYDRYLFHDGVFTVINGPSLILPRMGVIVSTLRSHGASELLGVPQSAEGFLDPSLLDGLLQMTLVILRELHQTSALPNNIVVDIYSLPVLGCNYLASSRISSFDPVSSRACYEGLITSEDGSPLLSISHSEMTHSKSMID
ncbi:SDR family NAD(P)-dependent oxidoreductase [Synechococcus sp. CBW1002]|nr:SDR family NAD(P)-dependent oxidoreductase [Synechococcus sp. CBW1002]